MKTRQNKDKSDANEIRSFVEFKELFYPKTEKQDISECADPERLGECIAKESLSKLQAALAVVH